MKNKITAFRKAFLFTIGAVVFTCSPAASAGGKNDSGSQVQAQRTTKPLEPVGPSIEFVRVKMGKSIFLDPPEEDEPQIYVRIRDTSGNSFDLESLIKTELENNGFTPTRKIKSSSYVLQANILFAEEVSEAQLKNLNDSDYDQSVGDILAGGLVGATAGGAVDVLTGDHAKLGAGSIIGLGLGLIAAADAGSKKKKELAEKKATKFFSAVVDIEVRQRVEGEVIRRRKSNESADSAADSQENSLTGNDSFTENSNVQTEDTQEYVQKSDWIRERVRVIASAKGKHITIEEIKGPLMKKLSSAISGIF